MKDRIWKLVVLAAVAGLTGLLLHQLGYLGFLLMLAAALLIGLIYEDRRLN